MKKLLVLFLVPILSMAIENDEGRFIGKWTGEKDNQIVNLVFDSEGYASFEMEGQIYGGKDFVIDDEKGNLTYDIYTETDPIHVDLIMTKLESGEEKKVLCIAKFISTDSLNFTFSLEGIRPTRFDTKYSVVFTRVKN